MISVLLPYRDVASTLSEALTTTLSDLGPDDELVAIDDGSRDDGPTIVEALARVDRRVTRLATHGRGIVNALASGLSIARGTFIGRMDGDDVTLPGRFAAQRTMLERDPRLGAVAVQVEAFPSPTDGMRRYVDWQNSVVTSDEHARAIFVESPLCHPATMLRRETLEAVGGFRDEPWAEDYDLWLRLDAAGARLAKVPEMLFKWRMRSTSLTRTDGRYSFDRLRDARAHYLARRLERLARPFAIWGAGQTGRRLARALEAHGARPSFFVDIDPRKVGRTARCTRIVDATVGIQLMHNTDIMMLVAVGAKGARDVVRARLSEAKLEEGIDYICAA